MSTSSVPVYTHAHEVVYHQDRYDKRRRLLRDYLLRPIGLGLLVRAEVHGAEYIPPGGPLLIMMNHIAGIDPFVVVAVVRTRNIVPMSKIENYENPITGLMARTWGAFPVRRGEIDRQALESTLALLDQGRAVLIAPEGTRKPALSEAKDGITYVAIKSGATILPVGLDGTDGFPGSLKRLRRTQVTVRFGRPFRLEAPPRGRVPRDALHQMTREAMWQLARLLPEHRRGFYRDLDRMTTEHITFVD